MERRQHLWGERGTQVLLDKSEETLLQWLFNLVLSLKRLGSSLSFPGYERQLKQAAHTFVTSR